MLLNNNSKENIKQAFINLQEISKKFSGMIFFSGDGAVEIMECNTFYIFPTEDNLNYSIEGDGDKPIFKSIYKDYELTDTEFDIYSLANVEARDTFGEGKILQEFKESLNTLGEEKKKYIINNLLNTYKEYLD